MLTRKKKTTPESDRFFSVFAGEFVKIYIKTTVTDAVTTPDGVVSQESPLSITGYLLDTDDRYYYLGEEPGSVYAAVAIKDVVLIQEVKLPDALDMVMDRIDMSKVN